MIDLSIAWMLVSTARMLTGLRTRWRAGAPKAEQTIFVANHSSHIDFVLVWAALPPDIRARTRPVAAADYWSRGGAKGYLAGRVFRAVLIDRQKSNGGPKPLAVMNDALATGDNLILFPEGTRNVTDDVLLPLKRGVYELARAHQQAQVVPVWIENLRRVLPKGTIIPVPLACTVSFGVPLPVQADEPAEAYLQRLALAMLECRPASAIEDRA
jgi:1-acyl-sn-glycerol-3-phosphate acyltransferase